MPCLWVTCLKNVLNLERLRKGAKSQMKISILCCALLLLAGCHPASSSPKERVRDADYRVNSEGQTPHPSGRACPPGHENKGWC